MPTTLQSPLRRSSFNGPPGKKSEQNHRILSGTDFEKPYFVRQCGSSSSPAIPPSLLEGEGGGSGSHAGDQPVYFSEFIASISLKGGLHKRSARSLFSYNPEPKYPKHRSVPSKLSLHSKVVPRSAVNPDFLEPFNCKGLFTTTKAITHRPPIMPLVTAYGRQRATCSEQPTKVAFSRLPDRNSGPGLIGIGLAWGLRTLYSDISYYFKSKVVPKSAVNPDFLEPFNCKGLFTTTKAITHRPPIMPLETAYGRQRATRSEQPAKVVFGRLPDRNPRPGLIGIGLASGLRTLFYENQH